jgi:alkane 1-monooxygenase
MRDLKYLIAYLAPLSALWAIYKGGMWSFSAFYLAFILIPVFDQLFPLKSSNFDPTVEENKAKNIFFDLLLYANVPILYGILFYFFSSLQSGDFQLYEKFGLTLSVGIIIGTIGINVGHELGHRNNVFEQFLSKVLLLPALYQHFFIEHNQGHHKYVATDRDPATSRLNEPIYLFWVRSVVGGYLSAWNIEKTKLRQFSKPFFSIHNQMLLFTLCSIAYLAITGLLFGAEILIWAVFAGIIGFLLLESVNYIEHYGLKRQATGNGKFEPVLPRHSWNSNHEIGRIFLYELTRHADHHYKSTRKYQVLRHFDESPQLPLGYPASILLSLLPPVWFNMMNPRVEQLNHPSE